MSPVQLILWAIFWCVPNLSGSSAQCLAVGLSICSHQLLDEFSGFFVDVSARLSSLDTLQEGQIVD